MSTAFVFDSLFRKEEQLFDVSWVDFVCWMALLELVRTQNSRQVSVVPVIMKCDLFKNNPSLVIVPYLVES
jgi:hypothetical protein